MSMQTGVEEIRISNITFIQAPKGFLERMSTQLNRWFGNETLAHPVWLTDKDVVVRVNDNVPPAWVQLFRALSRNDYEEATEQLKKLRATRNDYVDTHGIKARLMTTDGERIIEGDD